MCCSTETWALGALGGHLTGPGNYMCVSRRSLEQQLVVPFSFTAQTRSTEKLVRNTESQAPLSAH